MDRIRIAVVGPGVRAREFLSSCQDAGITALGIWSSDTTSRQAAKIASEYKLGQVYSDFKKLLLDKEVNTLYFPLSGKSYMDFAEEALKAGKNVIMEPDFTSCFQEARELIELAEINGSFLFELLTYGHYDVWERLKKSLIRVGRVRLIQVTSSVLSTRIAHSSLKDPSSEEVAHSEHVSLLKLNMQNISFLVGLFGKPQNIDYYANTDNGVDTSGVMVLCYPGFIAVATASRDSLGMNSFIIQGSLGFIRSPENPYSFHAFDLVMLDGTEHVEPMNPGSSRLTSELRLFRRMLKEEDRDYMVRRMNHKLEILEVLDRARRQIGIPVPEPSEGYMDY